ncbi:MAG: hypothetical protein ACI4SB_09975 [Acutalibacteraceae bacterium]
MNRKVFALLFSALLMILSLTACGQSNTTYTSTTAFDAVNKVASEIDDLNDKNSYGYSKGEVIDNTYYNYWMNLTIDMPSNYIQATDDIYQSIENEGGDDCGMYFVSDASNTVALSFADVKDYPNMTAEYYIEQALDYLADYGTTGRNISDFTIASKTFKCAHTTNSSYGCTQSFYAYRYGNKMCYIIITGNSVYENEKIASKFTTIF